jgi:hypothetical protein
MRCIDGIFLYARLWNMLRRADASCLEECPNPYDDRFEPVEKKPYPGKTHVQILDPLSPAFVSAAPL